MIPRLDADRRIASPSDNFLRHLATHGFEGDIGTGPADRLVFSTDNSIYQVEPAGIVFPKNIGDLKRIAKALARPEFSGVTIAPRGGGTGTNGQSLSEGIIVDCSHHMNRILEIDPVRRIARVEAGVVKDQLNKALAPHGLFFAPELSTSNRATIGGMVSTDACGQGSCLYGKTSNHVLGLRVVLADGSDFLSRPVREEELRALQARQDRIGHIHRTLARIARDDKALIERIFPKLNRFMTGYDLAHLQREDGRFDLNAVLCGSEGTLAMIAEAELNLLPIPPCAALINIRYDDFNAALEDARTLVALDVASVETIDETVLRLAGGDIVWPRIAAFFPGDADGINIAEVLADTPEELSEKLAAVTAALAKTAFAGRKGYTITVEKADIEAIWAMRKRAVGLLGNVEGPTRPVPFVEDTAVPPDHLAAYIREFRALLDAEGLTYGMFGHVDAGVLHVRPALDLTRDDHAALVRRISDAVVALTQKYGGVLWGEHGKGVRSEYVPAFFGPLYPRLQEIKQAFDPLNQLNPGKIVAPAGGSLPKIDAVPLRGTLDRAIGNDIRAAFDNAAYCNGNGACFDFDADSLMCPSYKATRDRRFSPKGRASLMREWLRRLSEKGIDPRREAEQQRRTSVVLRLARRAWNSLNPANRGDFSHEVRAAMDTCLACKACAGQCPVKVSVPAFRAKFFELYYGRYLRPVKDPIVATIETMLPLMTRARPLYNLAVGSSLGKGLLRRAGLTALPTLPALSLGRELGRVPTATPQALARLTPAQRADAVIFVPDAFTEHFDRQVLLDAVAVARRLGMHPFLAPPLLNGKALHVHGYLGAFHRTARRTARKLDRLAETGIPLVGLDPSMTLAFRSEYAGAAAMRARVLLPQEWLVTLTDRLPTLPGNQPRHRLMAHCTERSTAPAAVGQWIAVFAKLGIDVVAADTGCCGMAGTFGHEVRNREISQRLYAMSWQPALAATGADDVMMATGYSCRSQAKLMDERQIPHPLQILRARLEDDAALPLKDDAMYDM
ncbi:FAD-binding oxidoreductase [Shinella sp. CPCC 100929]|uniref:FAD-binding oxidoreductase n=1 Tax=Shinella lacus TaxID=2654216 RepID=A0ABT1R545_9HYPH|nr:FAD-binding and (Fe-S)-binding domain-containing protein [Shinella lacus]MCQ4630309.1 FAD-binding oxidoreductase [Shinella lacus]